MWAAAGDCKAIPQLHANGKAGASWAGPAGRPRPAAPACQPPLLTYLLTQLVGDYDTVQEMEDFGELDAALTAT